MLILTLLPCCCPLGLNFCQVLSKVFFFSWWERVSLPPTSLAFLPSCCQEHLVEVVATLDDDWACCRQLLPSFSRFFFADDLDFCNAGCVLTQLQLWKALSCCESCKGWKEAHYVFTDIQVSLFNFHEIFNDRHAWRFYLTAMWPHLAPQKSWKDKMLSLKSVEDDNWDNDYDDLWDDMVDDVVNDGGGGGVMNIACTRQQQLIPGFLCNMERTRLFPRLSLSSDFSKLTNVFCQIT